MTRGQKAALTSGILIVAGIVAGVIATLRPSQTPSFFITGAVLTQAVDPRRQMPIGGVQITATTGPFTRESTSDSSGLFRVMLNSKIKRGEPVALKFRHSGYEPLDITESATGQLYIARLKPLSSAASATTTAPPTAITGVRIRYSMKTTSTVNVGSFAKTFEVVNAGGVPCDSRPPCSPDGKWEAAIGSASFDAEGNNQFVNARASCIAGPCPFTSIQSDQLLNNARTIKVVALDWSATATFLVEAEVTRTFASDMTRHSYPVIFGGGMNFTLPPSAQGPSIEAELNNLPIVFPLGPDLILSWASCSQKTDADQSKLYRCQLKPGYEFR
ncbi:MAG: hypothetical protein JO097_19570 [Acidobacteriaceae bacterium]|nr:hypothetical protein [Acidobacteriaceae bacterium]MBV9294451.1 hypothetical protein [Acidobacteriaceae bacterium]